MTSNVVSIARTNDQTSFGEDLPKQHASSPTGSPSVVLAEVIEGILSGPRGGDLNLKQLYSEVGDDSRLLKALDTVERASLSLQNALTLDPATEFISFDLEIMTARSLLLNAFRYRDIGDGYAAIINAVVWALSNRGPKALSRRQINVIVNSLERISKGPFLHFDTSMQVLDELEEADLNIEPPSLDLLTADLDD